MDSVRRVLLQRSEALYVIPFDDRPGKLFEGLQHCRSVIFVARRGQDDKIPATLATTRYQRWASSVRDALFPQIEFVRAAGGAAPRSSSPFPKLAAPLQASAFAKLAARGKSGIETALSLRSTPHFVFYQEATQYWVKATVGLPFYAKNGVVGAPAHGRYLHFHDEQHAHAVCALLNSSLFYVYFVALGDCFHLGDGMVSCFPVTPDLLQDPDLAVLNQRLMSDLKRNSEQKTINTKDGDAITYAEFYGAKSKPIIDEIDRVLAKHYGFSDEELDFIINYDIKYRMGRGGSGDEADGE
jgi:hypothetical protein